MEESRSGGSANDAHRILAQINDAKAGFSKQKEDLLRRDQERLKEIKALQSFLKTSQDDQKDYSKFKIDAYKSDFISNPETANNISSVLSAMITHIDENSQHPWDQETEEKEDHVNSIDNDVTMAESLDDLFEEFSHEISCNLKLKDRGPDPFKESSLADTLRSKYIFSGKI